MSTVTIAPADTIREGHAVLHVAFTATWPADRKALKALIGAVIALGDALEVYRELDLDGLHWEVVYPHLRDEADPDGEALSKAADEVEAATEDLIKVMAAHCGTEDEMTIPGVGK